MSTKQQLKEPTPTWEEGEKIACARYCKVPVANISGIKVYLVGGDTRWIDTGRNVRRFVEAYS